MLFGKKYLALRVKKKQRAWVNFVMMTCIISAVLEMGYIIREAE
jgi:hypothetical protein